jgi:hypothetical protein
LPVLAPRENSSAADRPVKVQVSLAFFLVALSALPLRYEPLFFVVQVPPR